MDRTLTDQELQIIRHAVEFAAAGDDWPAGRPADYLPAGDERDAILYSYQDSIFDEALGDTGYQPEGEVLASLIEVVRVVDGMLGTNRAADLAGGQS